MCVCVWIRSASHELYVSVPSFKTVTFADSAHWVTGQGYLAWLIITEEAARKDKAIQNFIIIEIRTYRGAFYPIGEIMGPIYLGFTDLSFSIHVLLAEHTSSSYHHFKKGRKIALIVWKNVDAGELCLFYQLALDGICFCNSVSW